MSLSAVLDRFTKGRWAWDEAGIVQRPNIVRFRILECPEFTGHGLNFYVAVSMFGLGLVCGIVATMILSVVL